MFSKFVNYSVRILMIILGIAFIIYGILYKNELHDSTLIIVMGIVVTLFGVYRLIMYRTQLERYNFNINEDDNENEK
ncbi:MAG TPA: hypothetical protein PLU67_01565 [Candidatus Kapabacteria bacterium]|jgi:uncharacterized Tic20 family protein|nr:hypothetical protein [Candidatus Kapabacteria bacterium]HOM04159.1 hypothetical protein [Candidatus Kapabacteria bacterium]HOQ48499.1 hypothetical protein [Candidatus Kapabacteria bacterium]HPP40383.1 hypothetical protein [Candidatus Kapabacteria bacterium]HPU23547.1 hypothetical protein [Candidatus Kapabacteria bacterium]